MKSYFSPAACSLGIHLLLEEMGVDYEGVTINVRDGDQFKADYVAINPKSKVPAIIRDDGTLLTEFGVIARWLAHAHGPDTMNPRDFEEDLRITETLDYIVSTVHMQGFTRLLRPQKFTPHEADLDWVRNYGTEIVMKAMAHLSDQLADQDFIMGDRMTIADAALFYTLFWGVVRLKLDLPGNLVAYYHRMAERPAAQRAFELEGLACAKA